MFHCHPAGAGVNFGNTVMVGGGKDTGQIVGGKIEYPLMTCKGGDRHIALGWDCSIVFKFPLQIYPVNTDRTGEGILKGDGYIIRTGGTATPTRLGGRNKESSSSLAGSREMNFLILPVLPSMNSSWAVFPFPVLRMIPLSFHWKFNFNC